MAHTSLTAHLDSFTGAKPLASVAAHGVWLSALEKPTSCCHIDRVYLPYPLSNFGSGSGIRTCTNAYGPRGVTLGVERMPFEYMVMANPWFEAMRLAAVKSGTGKATAKNG